MFQLSNESVDDTPKRHRGEPSEFLNKPIIKVPVLKLKKLEGEKLDFVLKKYYLTEKEIDRAGWKWDENSDKLYMPMQGLWSNIGFVLRSFDKNVSPKAMSYRTSVWSQGYCIYRQPETVTRPNKVLIVEDQPSALRASYKVDAVALLGCNLGEEFVGRLKSLGFSEVILCLDADAFDKGLELQKKYLPLFTSFRVAKPPKDLKNMDRKELDEFLDGILRA